MKIFQTQATHRFNLKIFRNLVIIALILGFFIYSLITFNFTASASGFNLFIFNISKIVQFENSFGGVSNLFVQAIRDFFILLSYGIAGASFAFLVSLFSAPISTYHASKKLIFIPAKIIVNVLHFVPIILIAYLYIFKLNFYLGSIVTIFFISWTFMHRDLVQVLEKGHDGIFDTNKRLGLGWWRIVFLKVYPYNKINLWSIYLKRAENSLRSSTFINFFGAIHITTLIAPHFIDNSFQFTGFPLIALFAGYITLQYLIFKWLKFLERQSGPNYTFDNIEPSMLKFKVAQALVIFFLAATAIISTVVGFVITKPQEWNTFAQTSKELFSPNFAILTPQFFFASIFELVLQIFAVIVLVTLFGTLMTLFITSRLYGNTYKAISYLPNVVLYFFGAIPANLLFNLINGVFGENQFAPTAILAATLVSISTFSFTLRNTINKIPQEKWFVYQFERKRYGTLRAFKDHFIPHTVISLRFQLANAIEVSLQKIIILGLFNVNAIGSVVANVTLGTQSDTVLIAAIIPYMFVAFAFKIINISAINYDNLHYRSFWNIYGIRRIHWFFIDYFKELRARVKYKFS